MTGIHRQHPIGLSRTKLKPNLYHVSIPQLISISPSHSTSLCIERAAPSFPVGLGRICLGEMLSQAARPSYPSAVPLYNVV